MEPGALFVALTGPNFDGHKFIGEAARRGAVAAMTHGASETTIPTLRVKNTLAGLTRLASVWRDQFYLPIVAVTGSNGKTTVKEMVAAILGALGPCLATRGNFNNEIGVPLTLLGLGSAHRSAVVELGANHPGEIARLTDIVRPSVGIITLCAPAHLEGFGDELGVARAKGELFERLNVTGTAIINTDDEYAGYWRDLNEGSAQLTFGLNEAADISANWAVRAEGGSQIQFRTPIGEFSVGLNLPGKHNVQNAAAAVAAAIALGADADQIVAGLEAVRPVAGRLQLKSGARGSRIIDDTYNANPSSLAAGLGVLAEHHRPRWLVFGDMAELGTRTEAFHYQAGVLARDHGVDVLLAVGIHTKHTAQAFGSGARYFSDQRELIEDLIENLPDAATVLVKGSRSMHMEHVVSALTTG